MSAPLRSRSHRVAGPALLGLSAALLSVACVAAGDSAPQGSMRYPGTPPGEARARVDGERLELGNEVLGMSWSLRDGRLSPGEVVDRTTGRTLRVGGPAFELVFADGATRGAADLRVLGGVRVLELVAEPGSPRWSERVGGRGLVLELVDPDGGFEVEWRGLLRDGSNAVRQEVRVRALGRSVPLQRLVLAAFELDGARTVGSVQGSVVVCETFFVGAEHPMASNGVERPARRIGVWRPGEVLANEPTSLTWPLPAVVLEGRTSPATPARLEVLFQYTGGGHRLDVDWLALTRDGREIARDTHHGHTGLVDVDNRYVLTLPALDPDARYELVAAAYGDGGTDSSGFVAAAWLATVPRVTCSVPVVALEPGEECVESAVLGVVPEGQLRRGFLHYLERERTHPYRPFLHYNSWYDIGYFSSFDEADALSVVEAYGTELARKRGVVLDSFLMDDGWDDHASLWDFHDGFPDGFSAVREAARRFGAAPGVWLSPWGGYGDPRKARLAAGEAAGYETNESGFALSAPKYFERIRGVCLDMLRRYGVNQFKFDGISREGERYPGSRFGSDFQAAIQLISDLRTEKPDVFVNLTTGTWPSPFWLRFADSIWRGGYDHEFAGVGSDRQRWMTYRDGMTYRNVVRAGPLFPLSSLMVHGVIYAEHARALDGGSASDADLRAEIRTAFGMGTQLQELYVTPALMNERNWDDLAQAARWSRANAATLVDTHWVGGDPLELEVYGWASWSPAKAILTLRNPSDARQAFRLDPAAAFEPPTGTPRRYRFTSPFADQRLQELTAAMGEPLSISLEPFEVVVLEGEPAD